jgi:GNAT superfamily N-acetyltransferase
MTIVVHPSDASLEIDTDPQRLDVASIHGFLSTSYWSPGVPRAVVERAIAGSLVWGVYDGGAQVGFGRVVTDRATFAWLCDVFVLESYRGRGLARWLVQTIRDHDGLQGLRRFLLATRDAHPLYAQVGFTPLKTPPERWMEILDRDVYARSSEKP